jgi:hypothetical protein
VIQVLFEPVTGLWYFKSKSIISGRRVSVKYHQSFICAPGARYFSTVIISERPHLKDRLASIHAGAEFIDTELVEDGNLVSSRHPGDRPAFIEACLKRL